MMTRVDMILPSHSLLVGAEEVKCSSWGTLSSEQKKMNLGSIVTQNLNARPGPPPVRRGRASTVRVSDRGTARQEIGHGHAQE